VSAATDKRALARFLRRLAVGMAGFFGLGTVINNGLALLANDAALAQLGAIPYPLFWFEFAVGWLYLATAWGVARQRAWAGQLAWSLAVVHSLSATALWLWYFAGHPVAKPTLVMELLREGFWVLMGLYLWRYGAQPRARARRRAG